LEHTGGRTSETNAAIGSYIGRADERLVPIFERLIEIIERAEPRMQAAIKWGQLTFTVDGNWHHWICALKGTRDDYVSFVMHKGAILQDKAGMLSGTGKYSRQVRISSTNDVDEAALTNLIRQAVVRQTDMPL
jgi:hypothetical protein